MAKPVAVDTVVLSTQHHPDIEHKLVEAVIEEIIKPVLPTNWINRKHAILINPTGRFVIGGPLGDCGLTGRKIIVDTYGGMARHGGGCFSGKDPSKVDRSGSLCCTLCSKKYCCSRIADRCEIQISYAIGVAEPTSIYVDTFGTSKLSNTRLIEIIRKVFDLRPHGIITMLDLLRPLYLPTATYGHFGRTEETFTWEKLDKVDILKSEAGIK